MKFLGLEIKRAGSQKVNSALVPQWQDGMSWLSGHNFEAMVKAYKSWIYVCATRNATTVAKQYLNLYVAKPSKDSRLLSPSKYVSHRQLKYLMEIPSIKNLSSVRRAEEVLEITTHPFIDILNTANPFMSGADLFELTCLFLELTGNAYWYIVKDETFGIPLQIWILPSQFMSVVPSKKDIVAGYVYSDHTTEIPFEATEVIHFKYPNPDNFFYGISPLMAVADTYNTNENILKFTNALFTNMARPEGVLHTEQDLNEDDFEVLKKEWRAAYGGVDKARKTAVLPKGLNYKAITMTPQELDYVQGRNIVKEEICSAFGQSIALYSEKTNRANSEQAHLMFLRDTVQPRLRRIEDTINRTLMPLYDSSLFVAFSNPVPEDQALRIKERESNLKMGYTSINEERVLEGRDKVSWGDVPLVNQNMVSLGSAPTSPADQSSSSSGTSVEEEEDK